MDLDSYYPDWIDKRDRMLADYFDAEADALPDDDPCVLALARPGFLDAMRATFDGYLLPTRDEGVIEVLALLAGFEVET